MPRGQPKPGARADGRPSGRRGKRLRDITKQESQTPTRKSSRLEEKGRPQKQAGSSGGNTQRHPFPSQSISKPRSKQNPPGDSEGTGLQPEPKSSHLEQTNLHSSTSAGNFQGDECSSASEKPLGPDEKFRRKRKRQQETENPVLQAPDKPPQEQLQTLLAKSTPNDTSRPGVANNLNENTIGEKNINPVNHWVQEGSWPKTYFQRDPNMKRFARSISHSDMSYAQTIKERQNPPAYTAEYEKTLAEAGIFMNEYAAVPDTCKELCANLLTGEYETPKYSLFQDSILRRTLERVRCRNEARVVRDIMPLIVPSAELLYIHGLSHLDHLTEEIDVPWTKCDCIAGPRPQPDYAVGFMSSAFAKDEIEKLKRYTSPEKATLFTGNLYFPFLMCEVKSSEKVLDIADRQNAHSTSIAINAIVQLYRTVSREEELHQKILVFSISHNHKSVQIYGHYPLISKDKTIFYRCRLRTFSFEDPDSKEKWIAYNFTRKLYDSFSQTHLERIRSVILQLPDPEVESLMSIVSTENESGLNYLQEKAASTPSSRDFVFKKPKLPPTVMLQQEVEKIRQKIEQERVQNKQEVEKTRQEMEQERVQNKQEVEKIRQEMEQERVQNKQEKEKSDQRLTELMELLKQQTSSSRQEREKEKEQNKQEREQSKQEMKELMDLLKEQKGEKDRK